MPSNEELYHNALSVRLTQNIFAEIKIFRKAYAKVSVRRKLRSASERYESDLSLEEEIAKELVWKLRKVKRVKAAILQISGVADSSSEAENMEIDSASLWMPPVF